MSFVDLSYTSPRGDDQVICADVLMDPFSICLTLFIVYSTNMAAEALHCDGTGGNATGLLTLINTTDAFQSSTKTK